MSDEAQVLKQGVSAFSSKDQFFGVYDRKGGCIAVGHSSNDVVEEARRRLDLSSVQEVMNQYSVVQVDRAAYERFLKA